jgi:hypothetical protein
MKGTEKQIEYANALLDQFTARLMDNGPGDECETTRTWTANSEAFLKTLTDDAHLIIDALKERFDFRIDLQDIRERGADVWSDYEDIAKRSPVGYRRTMALKK